SGHGYQAALIMALTMTASAIHSQATNDPGTMLHALMSTLREELAMTEMFISAFYAIVDPGARALTYANTGHPHAFLLPDGGDFERLAASDPPLGMDERAPTTSTRAWNPGRDLLVLFTDGVSDARNRRGERLGEERVLEAVRAHRTAPPAEILDRVVETLEAHTQRAPLRDDLTVVLLRSSRVRTHDDARSGSPSFVVRPSARSQEPRSAFSQRPEHPRPHRRRARADRGGDRRRDRPRSRKPHRAARSACATTRPHRVRSRPRRAAPSNVRGEFGRSDHSSGRAHRSTGRGGRLGVQRRGERAVLHHDAHHLSLARTPARRTRRVPRAARGRRTHGGERRKPRVRRALGQRAVGGTRRGAVSRRARRRARAACIRPGRVRYATQADSADIAGGGVAVGRSRGGRIARGGNRWRRAPRDPHARGLRPPRPSERPHLASSIDLVISPGWSARSSVPRAPSPCSPS